MGSAGTRSYQAGERRQWPEARSPVGRDDNMSFFLFFSRKQSQNFSSVHFFHKSFCSYFFSEIFENSPETF
jgi:hypothetical protein